MEIDKALVLKLEKLARLELSEKERAQIEIDLNNILQMIQKLDELDTTGIEPLTYISEEVNVLRADEVKNQLDRTEALFNAPKKDEQYFKVPKVIDKKNL